MFGANLSEADLTGADFREGLTSAKLTFTGLTSKTLTSKGLTLARLISWRQICLMAQLISNPVE
jgi:uncharacterized protein YjbI with pentapeptide repeats